MLSVTVDSMREYIDRSVQTDMRTPDIPPSPRPAPPCYLQVDELHTLILASPHSEHSRSITQDESAYSHSQTDISFDSTSSERSMTTTTRAYNMELVLAASRPTCLPARQSSSRVVSLPEATPNFRMKTILEKKTPRIVSMPVPGCEASPDALEAQSIVGDPFVSEDEGRTRVRVRSHATDVPHTPSLPSSPDSVVIIANNSNQLSTGFLKTRVVAEPLSDSDNEGWIAWAQSPPRPIPALHGPLSLPYARCPSGAEGTIIEEPDSLPRVIWGLSRDATSNKSQANSTQAPPTLPKPPADTSGEVARPVPKNQHTGKSLIAQDTSVTPGNCVRQEIHKTAISGPAPHAELPPPPEFILKHSEPIDLERLMEYSHEKDYTEATPSGALHPQWQAPYTSDLSTPELVHDISPELQTALFAQDRSKFGLTPCWGSSSDIQGLSRSCFSTSSSSSSLLESLKSSRSPILLEELVAQQSPHSQGLASRASALDIAQGYRQQQLQGLLPTPPDTTSPIWASTFSPHQSGALSPELLTAAALSQMNLSLQANPSSSKHLMRAVPNNLGKSGLGHRNGSLSPAASIKGFHGQRIPPRLANEYARRRTVQDLYTPNTQLQVQGPVYDGRISPTLPKAPPNTPYGNVSSYGLQRIEAPVVTQSACSAMPTSNSAREYQFIGLSNHLRSVPLSRLVQRRLSTVPEEDYASSLAPGCESAQGTVANNHGLHLFLSASSRANVNAASMDMLGDHVGSLYDVNDMGVSADKARPIIPGVKLPNVTGREHGPVVSREAQFVKEGYGRQGSNANIDGGKRSEGGRGKGHRRGWKGKKGRSGNANGVHSMERVDGGLVVNS